LDPWSVPRLSCLVPPPFPLATKVLFSVKFVK
jgi:hypothetical protein